MISDALLSIMIFRGNLDFVTQRLNAEVLYLVEGWQIMPCGKDMVSPILIMKSNSEIIYL